MFLQDLLLEVKAAYTDSKLGGSIHVQFGQTDRKWDPNAKLRRPVKEKIHFQTARQDTLLATGLGCLELAKRQDKDKGLDQGNKN